MLTKVCESCSKQFLVKSYRFKTAKYCSPTCYGVSCRGIIPRSAFKKGVRPSPKTEFKSGSKHRYFGKSSPALGKHWKHPTGTVYTQKGKPRDLIRGDRHWNWQGGITSEQKRRRNALEYKLWRESVFKRDDYTCQFCGVRGGDLQADHIKPFASYPELRLSLDNGRTLCVLCHRKTGTFAGRGQTRQRKLVKS